jgi:hypothetical protein
VPTATAYYVAHQAIPEQIVPGKRLGRNYKFDSRSAAYPWQRSGRKAAGPVLLERVIPILDQGNVGSCTGNAETGALGTAPVFADLPAGTSWKTALNEKFAVGVYSDAENIDGDGPYPPNDNGSSGTSVMQVAKNRGLIGGYTHAMSVADVSDAVQSGRPVIIGAYWYDSFDSPDSSGVITITRGAQPRGGHEWLLRGDDPGAQQFFADNSWGLGWGSVPGNKGSFLVPYKVLDQLLGEQGDGQVPAPLSQPAPVPVPVPTPTPPGPGPDPDAAYGSDPKLITWAGLHHVTGNRYAAEAYTAWRIAKGYQS